MADEMFFTKDGASLRRGRRVARRTETCRPCMLTLSTEGGSRDVEGVVLDVNPYGMLIRMLETLPLGSHVVVRLMRDESFKVPMAEPREGRIVRHELNAEGFVDHGVKLAIADIERAESRPVAIERKPVSRPSGGRRMHTIDVTIGRAGRGKPSR